MVESAPATRMDLWSPFSTNIFLRRVVVLFCVHSSFLLFSVSHVRFRRAYFSGKVGAGATRGLSRPFSTHYLLSGTSGVRSSEASFSRPFSMRSFLWREIESAGGCGITKWRKIGECRVDLWSHGHGCGNSREELYSKNAGEYDA